MKFRTCSYCKNLFRAKDVKYCKLDNKPAFLCADCIEQAEGIMSKNKLVEGLNKGTIKIGG